MHLSTYLSLLGLSASLPIQGAALPRGRRSARHNKFVLVRSPQVQQQDQYRPGASGVVTAVADVISPDNSTTLSQPSNPTAENATDSLPATPVNGSSPVTNGTGFETIPPVLNLTDPAVSSIVSSLVATSTAYASFSYSVYSPTATVADVPVTSSASQASGTPKPSLDPVDQALQAAQSYAMNQEMGKHMPTVTVELVMVPTQVSTSCDTHLETRDSFDWTGTRRYMGLRRTIGHRWYSNCHT
jgi:hypothetical protein